MNIGVCISHTNNMNINDEFKKARELGFDSIQLVSWNNELWTDDEVTTILTAAKANQITISEVWVGWRGPKAWNFYEGHETLGFLPVAYRYARMEDLINGADFAKKLGVDKVVTHAGYIPENPHDPNYAGMITALRAIAEHLKRNGQQFLFETGQETPVTLLRAIEDIGTGNVGINLDPANLIMYGKGNPVDAVDTLGKYIVSVHAKDGAYPTDGRNLGPELALGEGKVNFPKLLRALKAAGFEGTLTIEREISGDQQTADIIAGKNMLETILAEMENESK